jgi:hypothetical protein
MNFIKEKRRQEIQAKIKRAEIAQKQKEAAAAREALQIQQTQQLAAQNQGSGSGGYQSSHGGNKDFMGGSGTSADMGSFAKGGIIGLKR